MSILIANFYSEESSSISTVCLIIYEQFRFKYFSQKLSELKWRIREMIW